jgi:hypothetical protein
MHGCGVTLEQSMQIGPTVPGNETDHVFFLKNIPIGKSVSYIIYNDRGRVTDFYLVSSGIRSSNLSVICPTL